MISERSLEIHLIQFGRLLRGHGYLVGPKEQQEALTALQLVGFDDLILFRHTLASVFCKSQNQQKQFDELFEKFWQELFRSFDSKVKTVEIPKAQPPSFSSLKTWLYQNHSPKSDDHEELVMNSTARSAKGMLPIHEQNQVEELMHWKKRKGDASNT